MKQYIPEAYPGYMVSLAKTSEIGEEIYRFRGKCFFNEEYKDEDQFDAASFHIVVTDRNSGNIVACYRVLLPINGQKTQFYSHTEFDIPENLLPSSICELGRACIANEYRNGACFYVLMGGLIRFMSEYRMEGAFGCASIDNDANLYSFMMNYIKNHNLLASDIRVKAKNPYVFAGLIPGFEREFFLPVFFKTYFHGGAKIISDACYDPVFNSIDWMFLWFMDKNNLLYRKFKKLSETFILINNDVEII